MTTGAKSICTLLLQSGWKAPSHRRRQRKIVGEAGRVGRAEQDGETALSAREMEPFGKGAKTADKLHCVDSLLPCTAPEPLCPRWWRHRGDCSLSKGTHFDFMGTTNPLWRPHHRTHPGKYGWEQKNPGAFPPGTRNTECLLLVFLSLLLFLCLSVLKQGLFM